MRLRIAAQRMVGLQLRRRTLAGPTGCGLCGVDSLEAALRTVARVANPQPVSAVAIRRAMAGLPDRQPINKVNGATHAGGLGRCLRRHPRGARRCRPPQRARQASGRTGHKRRKPTGRLHRRDQPLFLRDGAKAAAGGASAIAAVSAPTSLAIATAEQAGIALMAFVRDERLTVYAHPDRIVP